VLIWDKLDTGVLETVCLFCVNLNKTNTSAFNYLHFKSAAAGIGSFRSAAVTLARFDLDDRSDDDDDDDDDDENDEAGLLILVVVASTPASIVSSGTFVSMTMSSCLSTSAA
jgi:hypothetical protein